MESQEYGRCARDIAQDKPRFARVGKIYRMACFLTVRSAHYKATVLFANTNCPDTNSAQAERMGYLQTIRSLYRLTLRSRAEARIRPPPLIRHN